MRALRIIGFVLVALLGAATVLGGQAAYRFDLRINPVAAPILARVSNWGGMTELTPKPFSMGQNRIEIVEAFENAGFLRTHDDEISKRYESENLAGEELFQREADNLVCAIQLHVFLRFDDNEKLISARGTQQEHGCL